MNYSWEQYILARLALVIQRCCYCNGKVSLVKISIILNHSMNFFLYENGFHFQLNIMSKLLMRNLRFVDTHYCDNLELRIIFQEYW